MEKVIVFFDGGYLDHVGRDSQKRIDLSKFTTKLCVSNSFVRAYYYHCLPYQSNPPTVDERDYFRKVNSFFDRLKRLDRFQVRLGKLVKRGIDQNGQPIFNQKRVDVFLATDLVKLSAQKAMDQATLLTSDSDYVPAIQAAKELGVIVRLAYYRNLPIMQELLDACDERFVFDSDYLNDVVRV